MRSTQPDEAVLSLAHIVFAILFSVASADHTAFANHSGDNSVNGFIEPDIIHKANIFPEPLTAIVLIPVQNAFAHIVQTAHKVIQLVPVAYKDHTISPVEVITILHIPVAETTKDRSARPVKLKLELPVQLTHITALPVLDNSFSEKPTT